MSCEYASPAACAVGASVTANDICLVLGGEYHETVIYLAGALKAGLVFRCAPGFRCLIDGDGVRDNGFNCYDDWVIEGFEITNTTSDAITAYRRVSAVRDSYIHDVRGRGISMLSGTAVLTGYAERNVILNTGSDGIACSAFPAGPIVVRNNLVVDPSLGASGRGISCGASAAVAHNTVDVRNRSAPFTDPAAFGIFSSTAQYNVVAGGVTALSATVVRDHNLAWAWSSAPFAGAGDAGNPVTDTTGDPLFLTPEDWRVNAVSPAVNAGAGSTEAVDLLGAPRDGLPDLGAYEFSPAHMPAALQWPVREVIATPSDHASVVMGLRDGPDGGPLVSFLDVAANTVEFRARNTDGTWRSETVQSGLGLLSGFASTAQARVLALEVEPATGLPVVVYPVRRSGTHELRLVRRLGDACGTGCASRQWTGCADAPITTLANGETFSYRLRHHPVTGRPTLAVWVRTAGTCGSGRGADRLLYFEQQANGSWTQALVTSNTCNVNYVPTAFGFTFTPTGAAELVFSRTTGAGALDANSARGELLLATNAGGPFTTQVLPIGGGFNTAHGNSVPVASGTRPNGDLGVVYRATDGAGTSAFFLERVGGVWQAPSPLAKLTGLTDMVAQAVAYDPSGEPRVAFTHTGALELARRLPQRLDADAGTLESRWDTRSIDTQKDTGFFPTVTITAGGGLAVAYQQLTATRSVKLLADYDVGGVLPSVVDPMVCDLCPADPSKTAPGFCGCGFLEDPGISISDAMVAEGDTGSTQLTFTVTLDHACGAAVAVDWLTADGTATSGSDYNSAGGTVVFAQGEVSKTVTVTVLGDGTFEPDETVLVNLSGATPGATLLDAQGAGTIGNDDPEPDAGTDAGTGGGTGSDAGIDAGTGGGTGSDAGTDAGTGGGTGSDAGSDAGTGGGTGSDAGSDAGTGGGTGSDAGTDAGVVSSDGGVDLNEKTVGCQCGAAPADPSWLLLVFGALFRWSRSRRGSQE